MDNDTRYTVLVVDDEPFILTALQRLLRREFNVLVAHSGQEGLELLRTHAVQIILSDQRMAGMTGAEFLAQVRESYPDALRLILTGYTDLDSVIAAINEGHIFRYLVKPWNPDELLSTLREAAEKYRLILHNQQLVGELQASNTALEQRVVERTTELVGKNAELTQLYAQEQERNQALEALYQTATALQTPLDLDDLLAETLRHVQQAIPAAERGMVLLTNAANGDLCVKAVTGPAERATEPGTPAAADSACVQSLREGRSLLIAEFGPDAEGGRSTPAGSDPAGYSAMVAPMLWNHVPLGVLHLDSSQPAAFTPANLRLLETFAATTTSAIHNAQLYAEVQQLAVIDPLTGAYNRRGFAQLGEREVGRAQRSQRSVGAIMFDVDHFKGINDTYGHAAGDQVLAALGARCRETIRTIDILGRYGGDEFVALLIETDLATTRRIAQRLCSTVADLTVATEHGPVQLSLSLGVAVLDSADLDLDALLRRADQALYTAKQRGRNQVAVWQAPRSAAGVAAPALMAAHTVTADA